MTSRTLLIGLDGATFTVLDPLMQGGTMPFLRALCERGARAELRSVVPPLTPPAWTSLMTGRTPGYHGIFDFFQPDAPGSRYLRFASSTDVASETIWSMASRQGLSCTVLNFPLMFPPKPIDGYIVPGGWMPWKQLRLGCYPADLYDRLKALPGFNAREVAMDMTVEEKAIEGARDEEYDDWIALHTRREQHWLEIAEFLMREDPSDLTAILFDGVDKLQHLCWTYLDPAYAGGVDTARKRAVRDLCREYFRQLDAIMERLSALAGPDATVIVASDHGFGPNVEVFHINTWLEQNGYLAWANGHDGASSNAVLGMSDLARHAYRLDWTRTTAYAATPSSNGVHIVKTDGPESSGVPSAELDAFRRRLIAGLREVREPDGDHPLVTGIWTREEAFPGPRGEIGPDLTLALRDGGLVSILPAPDGGPAVRPRDQHSGAHRPEGVFIAAGPGIRAGLRAQELSILDVAPLALYSLGLPVQDDMEGHVPEEILEPEALQAKPVTHAAGPDPVAPPGEPRAADGEGGATIHAHLDAEGEATILARLRALGYVE
jgi:predicted AlkP superfamily phosphohydrolase/phosphomutase